MRNLVAFLCVAFLMIVAGAAAQAADAPERVSIGAYINDIQQVDLQSHSYRLDLYVWFRWHNPEVNPAATAEFMNAFDPSEHVRTPLYNEPQKMPDGSLYMIIREQGKFSAKFPLQKYPFDSQNLLVTMEDSVHAAGSLVYAPDTAAGDVPVSLGAHIQLPGFNIGRPEMRVSDFRYPTRFGDIREAERPSYSRVSFTVPVARPWLATGVKVFLPVLLVIFCTALVFFVHPAYIEGRLGVAITALLTLVALQLTTASGLPEADYMLMTDKVYLLSYLFIIVTMLQIVRTSALVQVQKHDAVRSSDRKMLAVCGLAFLAGVACIAATTF